MSYKQKTGKQVDEVHFLQEQVKEYEGNYMLIYAQMEAVKSGNMKDVARLSTSSSADYDELNKELADLTIKSEKDIENLKNELAAAYAEIEKGPIQKPMSIEDNSVVIELNLLVAQLRQEIVILKQQLVDALNSKNDAHDDDVKKLQDELDILTTIKVSFENCYVKIIIAALLASRILCTFTDGIAYFYILPRTIN